MVFSILYHILRDPDYWTQADVFKPERFLSPDGKSVIKEALKEDAATAMGDAIR